MQKIKFAYIFGILLVLAQLFFNFSNNPPNGKSGAPGDGTCADCHSGGTFNGTMTLSGIPATVTPNTTYTVTMTNSFSGAAPDLSGFQITPRTASNTQAGLVDNASPTATISNFGGKDYVEHNPSEFFNGNNSVTWQFDWTAPNGTDGEQYTFYYSGVFADGTGGTGSDMVSGGIFQTTLDVPDPLTASTFVIQNVSCNGESDGSAGVTPNGGTPPYFYNWSTGDNNPTVSNLPAGTHSVTIDDFAGQQTTAMVSITEPTNVGLMLVNQTDVNCLADGTAIVVGQGGTPGYNYAWSNNGNGSTQMFTAGGNYVVTVSDASFCTETLQVTIGENLNEPNADIEQANTLTCIESSVTLDGSASSSASGQIGYLWVDSGGSPISNSVTANVSEAGLYTLVVADTQNGCTSTAFVTVLENTNLPNLATSSSGDLSCAISSATLTATTLAPNASYEWIDTNGSIIGDTNEVTVNTAGTYTVVVTNTNNGCTNTATETVDNSTSTIDIAATVSGALSCENTSVDLIGTNASQGSFSYVWTDENGNTISTQTTATAQSAGTYTFTATDTATGCSSEATVTVLGDSQAPTANAGTDATLNCNTTSVTLDAMNSSTGAMISYEWFADTVSMATSISTNMMVDVTTPNEYILMVTNTDNGCAATDTVLVEEVLLLPIPNAGADAVLDCSTALVSLQGSDASGENNVTYQWFDASGMDLATTTTLEVQQAGTYTLIVTNTDSGCTASDEAEVVLDTSFPFASAVASGELACANASVLLDASLSTIGDNITYEWTDANGMVLSNNITTEVSQAGTYTLAVTNTDNNCTALTMVTATENTTIPSLIIATPDNLDCTNPNVMITPTITDSNDFTCDWTDENGNSISMDCNLIVSQAGIFTLTVTDNQTACTASQSVAVQANTGTVEVAANVSNAIGCTTTTATLDGAGSSTGDDISYVWSLDGMVVSTDLSTQVQQAGVYTLTVTDNISGCTNTASIEVIAAPTDISLTSSQMNVLCLGENNGSAAVEVAGGTTPYTYEWSTNATTETISNLIAGTYSISVTDANGCQASLDITITAPAAMSVQTPTTNESTPGTADGTAEAIATGGIPPYTYLWNTGATTSSIENLGAGTYSVVVTDANACSLEATTTITSGACTLSITATATDATCSGEQNGLALVDITGASADLTIEWSNGATTAEAAGLGAGTYTVTVMDGVACQESIQVTISEPNPIVIEVLEQTIIDCENPFETASIAVSGGIAPYTYLWSDDFTGTTNDMLPAGTHTVTVMDANGCEMTQTIVIEASTDVPQIDIITPEKLTCSVTEVLLVATVTSAGNVETLWTTVNGVIVSGTDTETIMVSAAGTYCLRVTNLDNGCERITCVDVQEDIEAPIADAGMDIMITCTVGEGDIDTSGSSMGTNYTYLWTTVDGVIIGDETTLNPVIAAPGEYCLTVTNTENGCTATDCMLVLENATIPTATVTGDFILTCANPTTVLDLTVGSDSTNVHLTHPDGTVTSILPTVNMVVFTLEQCGTYELAATSLINGCMSSSTFEITCDMDAPTADAGADVELVLNCFNPMPTTMLDLSGSSAGGNLSFDLTTDDGEIIDAATAEVTAGTYALAVTNTDNGCVSTDTVVITLIQDIEAPVINVGTIGLLSCEFPFLVTIDDPNPNQNIAYVWRDANGTILSTELSLELPEAGTYTLTATNLSNGCSETSSMSVGGSMIGNVEALITDANDGASDGAIDLTIDGDGIYIFEWSNGAMTEDVSGLEVGTYTVIIQDVNGCEYTETFEVELSTSIMELPQNTNITLFPNPNDGQFSIAIENDINETLRLEIVDFTGRKIKEMTEFVPSNSAQAIVLDDIAAGVYMVNFYTKNGLVASKKMLVSK